MKSFQSQDYLYRNILVILYPNLYNTIIKTNFMKVAFFETTKAGYIMNPAIKNLNTFDSQW
jgi:hypothetical protein